MTEFTTRQRIGNRDIVIVRKVAHMGKRGPKRKEGLREPNGRLDRRSTMQRLNEINASEARKTKAVVLAQPHRRGNEDRWLSSALGRFCRLSGCSEAVYNAVNEYAVAKHRWSAAVGRPRGYENLPDAGSGEGPSAEQVRRWHDKIMRVHTAIVEEFGSFVMSQIHRLAVEDLDLRPDTLRDNVPIIRSALGQIGVVVGAIEANPHPFRN